MILIRYPTRAISISQKDKNLTNIEPALFDIYTKMHANFINALMASTINSRK